MNVEKSLLMRTESATYRAKTEGTPIEILAKNTNRPFCMIKFLKLKNFLLMIF